MTRILDVSEATAPLNEYAKSLDDGWLVLTEAGRPIAVLAAYDADNIDTIALSSNPQFLAILESARNERRQGAGVSSDEIRRELGLE